MDLASLVLALPAMQETQVWSLCQKDSLEKEMATLSSIQFSSVQSLSHVRLFATPWIAARQASLSITNSWSSLRLTSIESMMPSSHHILCRPCCLYSFLILFHYFISFLSLCFYFHLCYFSLSCLLILMFLLLLCSPSCPFIPFLFFFLSFM